MRQFKAERRVPYLVACICQISLFLVPLPVSFDHVSRQVDDLVALGLDRELETEVGSIH